MPRWLQATPISPINAMPPTGRVWSNQHQKAARLKYPSTFSQHSERIADMLNYVARGDRIKGLSRKYMFRQRPEVDRETFIPCLGHRDRIEIYAVDAPSESFH